MAQPSVCPRQLRFAEIEIVPRVRFLRRCIWPKCFETSWTKSFLIAACALLMAMVAVSSGRCQPTPAQDDVERMMAALKIVDAQRLQRANDDQGNSDSRVSQIGQSKQIVTPHSQETYQLRLYDLSDLFQVSPHYPAVTSGQLGEPAQLVFPAIDTAGLRSRGGGGMGGGGGGLFNIGINPTLQEAENMSLDAATISLDKLMLAIKSNIDPDEWKNNKATASILGNSLLISATGSMHERIENLLDLFRQQWGQMRTVTIRVLFVFASPKEIRDLLQQDDPASGSSGVVSDELWQPFFEAAVEKKRIAYSVTLSGQNAQMLNACSGRQRYFVTDAEPIFEHSLITSTKNQGNLDEENSETEKSQLVGYQPLRQSMEEGAAVQATPLCTRGGNFVLLDLRTQVLNVLDPGVATVRTTASPDGDSADAPARPSSPALDNPSFISYRMSTTVRCPKEKVVLAGGMTFDGSKPREDMDLVVFVKSQIHTIYPDRSEAQTSAAAAKK